jgi:hypothetical protein
VEKSENNACPSFIKQCKSPKAGTSHNEEHLVLAEEHNSTNVGTSPSKTHPLHAEQYISVKMGRSHGKTRPFHVESINAKKYTNIQYVFPNTRSLIN